MKRRVTVALIVAMACACAVAFAAPKVTAVPIAPLPMLPSIPRVSVIAYASQVVVIEDVNVPRGEWKGGPLDFYVAFGAPGMPRAIDARLLPVVDGALEPDETEQGEAVAVDRAARRPHTAHPLLGRDPMAGVVLHVRADAFARAVGPGGMAALRIRTVLELPKEDPAGAHGIVVRLGVSRGTPLTLARVVFSQGGGRPVTRADAHLCGAEADPHPLVIAVAPKPAPRSAPDEPSIAPVLAVRHASDDLCVRFWTAPDP